MSMSNNKAISEYYTHGKLLEAIHGSLIKLGKTVDTVTLKDLAPMDEFHIGGRLATDHLLDQLDFSGQSHLLDIGCGLGGASRFVANKYNNRVTGIDLTHEYIDVGTVLCSWVGLDRQVTLHQGSALFMPFKDEMFDGALMLHVGMNIDDKIKLFSEVYRVLGAGASFAIYDVMQIKEGELIYPVPWAKEKNISNLATPDQYKHALKRAGFKVSTENNRHDFALDLFKKIRAKKQISKGPSPFGLHTIFKETAVVKVKNLIENIMTGFIAPVEIIAQKR